MQAVVGALRAVLGLDSIAFEKGAQDAKRQLSGLEKSFNQFGSSVGGMASKVSGVLASIGVGLSLGGLIAFNKHVTDTVGGLGELATQLGTSTDALQAYQFAAVQNGVKQETFEKALIKFNQTMGAAVAHNKEAIEAFDKLGIKLLDVHGKLRPMEEVLAEAANKIMALGSEAEKTAALTTLFGRSGARLLPLLPELAQGIGAMTTEARKAGAVISTETIAQLDKLSDAAAAAKIQFTAFYAELAAPIETKAFEIIAAALKDFMVLLKDAKLQWIDFAAYLANPIAGTINLVIKIGAGSLGMPQTLEGVDAQIKQLEEQIKRTPLDKWLPEKMAQLQELRRQLVTVVPPGTSPKGAYGPDFTSGGAFNPVPTNKGAAENFAKLIEKMRLEAEALQLQLGMMKADTNTPWPEFQKQMESMARVEKQIADFRAKEGLDEKHPKVAEFAFRANALEKERLAIEAHSTAAQNAESIERQWGDGSRQLTVFQKELNAALATGRVTTDAAKLAMDEMTRSTDLQRLRVIGLTNDGWGGFFAGFKTAQMEWERANSAFAAGQKAFESVMSHMEDALAQFVTTGKLKFRDLANSIISDLIRMQIKAATTSLFGGGGLGGLIGKLFGGGFGGAASGSAGAGAGAAFGGFAAGGMPPIGQPSWVGEKGPELFVPRAAGNIIPNDALGGGGATIIQNINVTGGDEAGVYRALNRVMPVLKEQMADFIVDKRVRGGRFSQAFRG